MVDIENLKKYVAEYGNTVESYKKLTQILNDKYTENSDRKKKQLENFSNYFSWRKSGREFIIEEIFENPITPFTSRRSHYQYNIANILPWLIENKGTIQPVNGICKKWICMSRLDLACEFGFINSSFKQMQIDYMNRKIPLYEGKYNEFLEDWNRKTSETFGSGECQMQRNLMLNWVYKIAIEKAYQNIQNAIRSFKDNKMIECIDGYEILFKNSENHRFVFEGERDYVKIKECEQKAVNNFVELRNNQIYEINKQQREKDIQREKEGLEYDSFSTYKKPLPEKLKIQDLYMRGYGDGYRNEFQKLISKEFRTNEGEVLAKVQKVYMISFHDECITRNSENIDISRFRYDLNEIFYSKLYESFCSNNYTVSDDYFDFAVDFFGINETWTQKNFNISLEEFMNEYTYVMEQNEIVKKNMCYNEYDLKNIKVLLAMTVSLDTEKKLKELRKMKKSRR